MKFVVAATFALTLFMSAATPAYAADATFFGPIIPEECKCRDQVVQAAPGAPASAAPDKVATAPDYGCVLQVIQNSINFAVSLSVILFVIYLAIGGFRMMISGSNSEARSQAKTRLLNVMVGLAILLCSWLVIDYVMKTIYDEGKFGPWNAILANTAGDKGRCIIAKTPTSLTDATADILFGSGGGTSVEGTPTGGTDSGTSSGGNGSCAAIAPSGLATIPGTSYQLIPSAVERFNSMKAAAARDGVTITVVSGYRSPDRQLEIWNQHKCQIVNGKTSCTGLPVALPCSLGGSGSNHTRGTAIDVSSNSATLSWLRANGSKYGFINSLPTDPIHFSDTGR